MNKQIPGEIISMKVLLKDWTGSLDLLVLLPFHSPFRITTTWGIFLVIFKHILCKKYALNILAALYGKNVSRLDTQHSPLESSLASTMSSTTFKANSESCPIEEEQEIISSSNDSLDSLTIEQIPISPTNDDQKDQIISKVQNNELKESTIITKVEKEAAELKPGDNVIEKIKSPKLSPVGAVSDKINKLFNAASASANNSSVNNNLFVQRKTPVIAPKPRPWSLVNTSASGFSNNRNSYGMFFS